MMTSKTEQIRSLNDQLRQNLSTDIGTAVITIGVAALGDEAVARIVKTIAVYDDFCHDNDPHGEHDFGAIEHDGVRYFWKIDAYDRDLDFGSTDPSDREATTRVLTIMLAEEY
jgi:Protein of unknown function (DUF3768)